MDNVGDIPQIGSNERNDDVIRSLGFRLVRILNPLIMSDDDSELLWEFVKTQDYMFSDFERGNREGFLTRLRDMRHLHLDLDGDGYGILLNAWACDTPELHYCIWKPGESVHKIMQMGTEVLNFAFGHLRARRMGSFIPDTNESSIKIATLMGFKYEGCIREGFLYFGKAYDVHAYGLLRWEWEKRKERLSV